jgi:hypothetical protein
VPCQRTELLLAFWISSVTWKCSESDASEGTPVQARFAPPVPPGGFGPKLLQPVVPVAGGFPHGQLITPPTPGKQKGVVVSVYSVISGIEVFGLIGNPSFGFSPASSIRSLPELST